MANKLRPDEREERVKALAPLYAWMAQHGVSATYVISKVYAAHGRPVFRSYPSLLKRGMCPIPTWLIPDCCLVMGVPTQMVYPDLQGTAQPSVPTREYSRRRYTGRRHRERLLRRQFLTGEVVPPVTPGTLVTPGTPDAPSRSPAPSAPSAPSIPASFSEWTVA